MNKPIKWPAIFVAGLLALAGVWALTWAIRSGPGAPAHPLRPQWEFTGDALGTTYSVKVVTDKPADGSDYATCQNAIVAALNDVNDKMSTYRDNSELSRFNQFQSTKPFHLSKETLKVFEAAQHISELSGGAFDVTVGPLVNAWGFGPDKRTLTGPDEATLQKLRKRVGYHYLTINPKAGTIAKSRPDVYCDLSAIAKGYSVDKIAHAIDALGFPNYMIEVGGEVRTKGLNAESVPWRMAIEKPVSEDREIEVVIPLSGLAMATSGDYRNYYEINGKRLSHEINPKTGRPIEHNLASASVINKDCMMADGFATALMVLGPEAGYKFAIKNDLAAFFIIRKAKGVFVDKMTPEFKKLVQKKKAPEKSGQNGVK